MRKIAVLDTVGESYAYSFRHCLKLFEVIWLPLLIATVASFYISQTFLPENIAFLKAQMASPGTPLADSPMTLRIWLLYFAIFLLMVMMAAGITKEVLGLRETPHFVYFRFGADELRLLAGLGGIILILGIGIFGAAIVASIVAAMTMTGAATQHDPRVVAFMILRVMVPILAVLYVIGLYFFLRLAFFLPPVVVVEKQIGVGRSWELSSGNFFRILAIALLIWIPMSLAEIVIFGVILGPSVAGALANEPHVPQAFVIALLEAEVAKIPYLLGTSFILSPFIYGLIVTPAAFAYKAVAQK